MTLCLPYLLFPANAIIFFFLLNIKVLYDKRDSAYRKSKLLVRALNVTDIVFSTFARTRLYRS